MSLPVALRKLACVGALAGIALFAVVGNSHADPIKIRLAWAVTPAQLAPILFAHPGLAQHLNQSYTLETQRMVGSSVALQALAAGELDISPMTFNVLGPAILNAGLNDLRIVFDEVRDGVEGYDTNRYIVLKAGPVQKVEDLKGKVVAINGIGGGQDIFMRVMLRKHGLEYPRDYTIVEAQFPNMKSLLIEKKADLVVGVKPFTLDPELQAQGRDLFTQRDAVGSTDFLFLTARTGFIEKNRAAIVDFFEDDIRATRWYMDPANHAEAAKIVSDFIKVPPERLGWIFTHDDFYRDPNLTPDVPSIQKNVDMLVDFGFIPKKIDLSKQADLSMVKEAAARLK
jgi:NitT/TauT family transport system substrate-binding protein